MTKAVAERQRLSAIAHAGSLMWGPISEETVQEMMARLRALGIGQGSTVLDVGCGPAELLRRVCEETGASGIGVDTSPFAIEEARRRIATSPARERVALHLADATTWRPDGSHNLVICIGPGWDSGGWTALAIWASGHASAGGHLLLGEAAWRSDPPADALATLGIVADAYILATDVDQAVVVAGAEVEWSHWASRGEWAAYAEAYRTSMRQFVRDHPDDPITPAVRERAGSSWVQYELLHELLDFVIILARPRRESHEGTARRSSGRGAEGTLYA